MPAGSVASVVHHGALNRFMEAYAVLFRWIGANGYRLTGPGRELYRQITRRVTHEDEGNLTDIQFPVQTPPGVTT